MAVGLCGRPMTEGAYRRLMFTSGCVVCGHPDVIIMEQKHCGQPHNEIRYATLRTILHDWSSTVIAIFTFYILSRDVTSSRETLRAQLSGSRYTFTVTKTGIPLLSLISTWHNLQSPFLTDKDILEENSKETREYRKRF